MPRLPGARAVLIAGHARGGKPCRRRTAPRAESGRSLLLEPPLRLRQDGKRPRGRAAANAGVLAAELGCCALVACLIGASDAVS